MTTDYYKEVLLNSVSHNGEHEHRMNEHSEECAVAVLEASCKQRCDPTSCQCQLKWLREFYSSHMLRNIPCIITGEITAQWRSVREWVDGDGNPNFSYLTEHFGMVDVPVADCDTKYYNSQQKSSMKFKDYIEYWKQLICEQYEHKQLGNLYLKDWHFTKDFPDYVAYETPQIFQSDWLNEFWSLRDDLNDDYRFVYMGPKGSWTPLHIDVYNSYSWSANICGRKLWILFPPEEDDNLRDSIGNLPYDVRLSDLQNIAKKYEVIQEPGQIIFIPSGWIHQEDTISINHNWFNGCNIDIIWKALVTAFGKVQKEIMDCRNMDNWDEQCQLITRSTHGMDVKEFWTLLKTIAESKLEILRIIKSRHKGKFTIDKGLLHEQFHNNPSTDCKILQNHDTAIGEDTSELSWDEAHVLFELSKIWDLLDEIMNNESTRDMLPLSKFLHKTIALAIQCT